MDWEGYSERGEKVNCSINWSMTLESAYMESASTCCELHFSYDVFVDNITLSPIQRPADELTCTFCLNRTPNSPTGNFFGLALIAL